MTRERFTSLVEEALARFRRRFRDAMKNVAVVVEDEPSQELLDDLEMEPGDTLFGLYHGTPLTERESHYGNTLPDRISIYQLPIEEACEDEEDITAVRRRDRHPRVRPLFRIERGGNRRDRGEVLARSIDVIWRLGDR